MLSPHVSQSTSTATSTSTTTTVTVSGGSQPESAAEHRPQGYFMGLLTTPHAPAELTQISSNYYQQDELRLLPEASVSDISASQTDPLEALTQFITVTFSDDRQGGPASSLSLSSEPVRSQKSSPQPVNNIVSIVSEEPSPDPTNKGAMNSRDSKLRCYLGDCTGTVRYPNKRALIQHIHINHILEKPFGCDICDKRFKHPHHLKYHREHVHSTKSKKKLLNPQSVLRLSSATTATTNTITSTITFGVSHSELAAGQQQGSFMGLSKTVHTPEPRQIPEADHQFFGLRLLAEVSASQIEVDPFEALATHQTVTFDDKVVTTGIAGAPNLPSDQYQAEQSPDLTTNTDKWIIVDKSQKRPYMCGFPECDKNYKCRSHLIGHFITHTGVSKFKCIYPECKGKEYFRDRAMLKRHIVTKHKLVKSFQCPRCNKRFTRRESLKHHEKYVYCIEEKRKSPKGKRN